MDLKLGHHAKDGIEVIDAQGEIDMYTAPRLRELLIDLVGKGSYQLVVNLDKVGFLDSTGLGVLVGGLKRVRAHDGSLDLVCTQQRILKIFRITGLTAPASRRHARNSQLNGERNRPCLPRSATPRPFPEVTAQYCNSVPGQVRRAGKRLRTLKGMQPFW